MLVEMPDSGHETILEFLFGGDTDVTQYGSVELGRRGPSCGDCRNARHETRRDRANDAHAFPVSHGAGSFSCPTGRKPLRLREPSVSAPCANSP
jgi:hypothetical protein